jgi:hypothetical protein
MPEFEKYKRDVQFRVYTEAAIPRMDERYMGVSEIFAQNMRRDASTSGSESSDTSARFGDSTQWNQQQPEFEFIDDSIQFVSLHGKISEGSKAVTEPEADLGLTGFCLKPNIYYFDNYVSRTGIRPPRNSDRERLEWVVKSGDISDFETEAYKSRAD